MDTTITEKCDVSSCCIFHSNKNIFTKSVHSFAFGIDNQMFLCYNEIIEERLFFSRANLSGQEMLENMLIYCGNVVEILRSIPPNG